jgi:hypothetical protein
MMIMCQVMNYYLLKMSIQNQMLVNLPTLGASDQLPGNVKTAGQSTENMNKGSILLK